MNTKDLQLGDRIFGLLKGEPKVGKSIAAHSFPDTYTFDNDVRMASVKNFYRGRDFEYDNFRSIFDITAKIDQLHEAASIPYKTIIFDGITSAADMCIQGMISTRTTKNKIIRGNVELPQIEDYGGESRILTLILEGLLAISLKHKCHVLVIAHVLRTETFNLVTQKTNESRTLMTAGKKVAAKLPVHFDEAYHFDVRPALELGAAPQYIAYTRHAGNDWAGTALPLPPIIDFTNKSFYDEIKKYLEADKMVTRL